MAFENSTGPDIGPRSGDGGLFARKGRASARGFGTGSMVDTAAADVARPARPRVAIEMERAHPGLAPSRRPPRALVADGDRLSRKLYRDVLEADGYEVVLAADGARALEAARRHAPDVVVVNLRLADLPGLELARRIAAERSGAAIPIVAIAEMHRPDDEAATRAGGCAAYLAKPIAVRLFLDTVDGLVRGAGALGVDDRRREASSPN